MPPKLSYGETLEFVVLPICSIPLLSFRYIFFCAVYSTRVLAIWVQKPILQDLYLGAAAVIQLRVDVVYYCISPLHHNTQISTIQDDQNTKAMSPLLRHIKTLAFYVLVGR